MTDKKPCKMEVRPDFIESEIKKVIREKNIQKAKENCLDDGLYLVDDVE